MNLDPCQHPHVLEYIDWPDELTLFFSGDSVCSLPCWAWALMDETTLYASDRGWEPVVMERSNLWCATVGLGKGCAFLNQRGWKGELSIKSHLRDCGIFRNNRADRLTARCMDLLAGIRWYATVITGDENHFACQLVREAHKEWSKQ